MIEPRTSLVQQPSTSIGPTRGVLDLARRATAGEVATRRHAASRERLLDRLSSPTRPATVPQARAGRSKFYALVAVAAVLALALVGGGVAVTVVARPRPAIVGVDDAASPEITLGEGAPRAALVEMMPFRRRARECWRSRLLEEPTMRGRVTLAVTLDDAGHVASASLAERQGLSDEVARCLVRATADLSFDPPGEALAFRLGVGFRNE